MDESTRTTFETALANLSVMYSVIQNMCDRFEQGQVSETHLQYMLQFADQFAEVRLTDTSDMETDEVAQMSFLGEATLAAFEMIEQRVHAGEEYSPALVQECLQACGVGTGT